MVNFKNILLTLVLGLISAENFKVIDKNSLTKGYDFEGKGADFSAADCPKKAETNGVLCKKTDETVTTYNNFYYMIFLFKKIINL